MLGINEPGYRQHRRNVVTKQNCLNNIWSTKDPRGNIIIVHGGKHSVKELIAGAFNALAQI